MELKRKCEDEIKRWLKGNKKALLVKGARQVGKTHIIRAVLNELECDYLEINLIKAPEAVSILEQASSADDLILGFSTISGKRLKKGESIIFIDEVQKYKDMVTKIKFLAEEGSFRYVLSGSLLGVELSGLESAPVGYLHIIDMFPLDFEEFLQITNITEEVTENLRHSFVNRKPVMDVIHQKMSDMFLRYLVVGGMPEAVKIFADTNNLNDVIDVHRDIKSLYKLDFTQYETEDKKLLISNAYDIIPSELLKQNKRFFVSDLKQGKRFDRVQKTFLWLENAGVSVPVYNSSEPKIPLKLSKKQSLFKLYLSDVGMLTTEYGMSTKRMLINRDSNLNAGGIFENAIAQTLYSKKYDLYYYNSNRIGELDFLIEYNGKALPIEVKSGKKYTVHSALNKCINNPDYEIGEAIVFADCNVSVDDKIAYMPVYMSMFLDEDSGEGFDVKKIVF